MIIRVSELCSNFRTLKKIKEYVSFTSKYLSKYKFVSLDQNCEIIFEFSNIEQKSRKTSFLGVKMKFKIYRQTDTIHKLLKHRNYVRIFGH